MKKIQHQRKKNWEIYNYFAIVNLYSHVYESKVMFKMILKNQDNAYIFTDNEFMYNSNGYKRIT